VRRILSILFCKNAIRCVVVLFVLIAISSGIGVEFIRNKELFSMLGPFGKSYPLITKCISAILKILPAFAVLSVIYLQIATIFKLVTLFHDKENAYFEKIKLLLYFKTTWIIATGLTFAQYALFLTVRDGINGLWVIYFLITSIVLSLFTTSLPLVTFIGSLFCIFEIKKYWKEIKSFYFLPCLYPIFVIIYFGITFIFASNLVRNMNPLNGYFSFLPILIIGILLLDYKRSAKTNFALRIQKAIINR
jgi:hypothetical protein